MKSFNVKLLYVYKFTGQCLPIYAFYTILFIERGLSVTDVALLIALWSGFTIAFEVPAGMLADRWNRRNLLAIAAVLQGLCFVIWFFAHSFFLFAAGFACWGIACALVSGTEEGLIYDNLKFDGNEQSFTTVYGRAQFWANTGAIAGIASAGVLASLIPVHAIAPISAAICLVNGIVVLQLREKNEYADRLAGAPVGPVETFRQTGRFIRGNRVVLVSILFLVCFAGIGSYLDEYDALIVNDLNLGNIWVSVILTVRFVCIALGDILAPLMQKRVSSTRQLFLLTSLSCALLAVFAIFWNQYVILIFGLGMMAMAIAEVLFINVVQNQINDEGRATVMSVYSIGQNGAMVCFSLIYALLAGLFPLQQVYILISIYGMIGSLSVYLYFK